MGTERDRYPAAERTAQPGTLQKLKNNGTAGGEARSRGGSRKGEQTHAGCDQSQGCYLMRVCILSCLSESWFFLDQGGCTEESRAGAGRGGGPLLSAPPTDGSEIRDAIPGALLLNRDGNQAEEAATPSLPVRDVGETRDLRIVISQ